MCGWVDTKNAAAAMDTKRGTLHLHILTYRACATLALLSLSSVSFGRLLYISPSLSLSLSLPLSLISCSTTRGYKQDKLTENVQCEIMQVVLEEARESYALESVQECPSNTLEDMTSNVSRMQLWLEAWLADKAEE